MSRDQDDRQPVFNAPWPALVLVAAILIAFLWQQVAGSEAMLEQ